MWQVGFNGFVMDVSRYNKHDDFRSPIFEQIHQTSRIPLIAWNVDITTERISKEKDFQTIWDILSVSKSIPFSQFKVFLNEESRPLFSQEYEKILNGKSFNMLIDVQVLKLDSNYDNSYEILPTAF